MDAVGKRIVFFQALTVLQVAKIYQWFVHPWTWEVVGLWQWILVDVLVLLYASRSGIKFPTASPSRIYLGLFVLLFLLNVLLAHSAVCGPRFFLLSFGHSYSNGHPFLSFFLSRGARSSPTCLGSAWLFLVGAQSPCGNLSSQNMVVCPHA